MGLSFNFGGRRGGYGAHEYYDAMTTSDEPWKWASLGTGIGGVIGGAALAFLVNPIAGFALIGAGLVSSVVCGIVATYKHKKELNHYIMEDRKRMADHCDAKDRNLESGTELNTAEKDKVKAETKVIEDSTKNVNNSDASLSKDTINRSKSTDISK